MKLKDSCVENVSILIDAGDIVGWKLSKCLWLKNEKRHQAPLTSKSDMLPTSCVCGQKMCVFRLNSEIPDRNVDVLSCGLCGGVEAFKSGYFGIWVFRPVQWFQWIDWELFLAVSRPRVWMFIFSPSISVLQCARVLSLYRYSSILPPHSHPHCF